MNLDELRKDYDIVPIARELSADALTPVAAFAALSGDGEAFLFESVERGENVGRYSFVGFEPRRSLRFDQSTPDPIRVLNNELQPLRVYGEESLPPFFGGAVGFFGYSVAGWSERIPDSYRNENGIPDARLIFFDNVVVFDHVKQRLYVIANIFTSDAHASIEEANARLDRAIERLRAARVDLLAFPDKGADVAFTPNIPRDDFEAAVRTAKEEIVSGEIFQIVLSQRWSTAFPESDALTLYRVLRSINPSPYMFLLRTPECTLVGASPEMLVRKQGRHIETRPIAGTRPRGMDADGDKRLAEDLLADPKERAEHVMLVDLGRNDLGRVAESGSVRVPTFMEVEHYSHVMHLVSSVEAELATGKDALDALLACFPAGTVSGAPKIRAMQIIDELEPEARGPYAGAVGYLSFSGDLDTCIAIRTLVVREGETSITAGAGIVADSDPAAEERETKNKAAALLAAVALAEELERRS